MNSNGWSRKTLISLLITLIIGAYCYAAYAVGRIEDSVEKKIDKITDMTVENQGDIKEMKVDILWIKDALKYAFKQSGVNIDG